MSQQSWVAEMGLAMAAEMGQAPSLEWLYERQRGLLELLQQNGKGPVGPGSLSVVDLALDPARPLHMHDTRVRALLGQFDAIIHEAVEARDWLPWKHWKTYQAPSAHEALQIRGEVAVEVVDMLHFVLNAAILLGLGPKELAGVYAAKNQENRDRASRGY